MPGQPWQKQADAASMDQAVEPVPMPGEPRPEPSPDSTPGASGDDDTPMTPHATPLRDAQGRLTYVGEDGRRYVVAPSAADGPPTQDG